MSTDNLLVIDAGTGGGRAVVFDCTGQIQARAYRAWSYYAPEGLEMYGKEFNPDEFWGLIVECIKEVLKTVDPGSINAVTSTSMRQGCVFLDKDGKALYGGPNLDVRGMVYAIEMEESMGEDRTFNVTGHWPPWMTMAARLFWFREDEPEIYSRIASTLMINDWILFMLAGETAGEPTNACETLLMDLKAKEWSKELLETLDLNPSILPEIRRSGDIAGKVTKEASGRTGIPQGIPVVIGAADTQAALFGAGVINPGQVGIVAGTTAPVMMVLDNPFLDQEHIMWTDCHIIPDRWLLESNCGDAGKILRWYAENVFGEFSNNPYTALFAKAESVPPGSDGIRCFLGPMIWNLKDIRPTKPSAVLIPYPLEPSTTTAGHLVRAILENIAYAARGNLEQIITSCEVQPESVTLCGGMTRSDLFNRIVAAVLNKPVRVSPCAEATALGAAMAAGVGAGIFDDLDQAAKSMAQEPVQVESDEDWADEYDSCYDIWKEQNDLLGQEF